MNPNGSIINGRKYSKHALERMAPKTTEVKTELTKRAMGQAKKEGIVFKNQKELDQYLKKYVDPRNIPPIVIEDAIKNGKKATQKNGNLEFVTKNVKVITNKRGDVVTVFPLGRK